MPAFFILGIICLVMAVLSCMGEQGIQYSSSLPMVVLWAVASVAALVVLIRRKLHRDLCRFSIHVSFLVIMTGALVTWLWGTSETLHLRIGEPTRIGDMTVELLDFEIVNYPGTRTPCDYVSEITVDDNTPARVAMNKVYSHDGYRFYQSAYDPDGRGTILTVAHDPAGVAISYTGYAMLLFSMIWYLVCKYLSGRRVNRRAAVLVSVVLCSIAASAAPNTVPREVADRLGNLYIYADGRIMQLSTYARLFSVKLTGSANYEGLAPEQIMAGWLFNYDSWKKEPCIAIRDKSTRREFQLPGKRASVADFFAPDGSYRADSPAHSAANEQFGLLSQAATGSLWKVFPTRDEQGHYDWLSPVDDQPDGLDLDQWHFTRHALNYLAELIATNRTDEAIAVIDKIGEYQRHEAGSVLPSSTKTLCEDLFVRLAPSPLPAIIMIVAALILFFAPHALASTLLATASAGWILLLIILDWIASGSIPMANGYETMQWMALAACACGIGLARHNPRLPAICCIVAGLALMVAMMGHRNPQITTVMPVLRSPLLSVHVLTVMLAYAGMAVMALCGLAWHIGRQSLLGVARSMLCPVVFLMCIGIFIGAVWANQSWGRYWGWDPKETWALITMLIYSAGLHTASLPAFRSDRFFARFVILAFLSVIMTYFGVNFILGGLHSYA